MSLYNTVWITPFRAGTTLIAAGSAQATYIASLQGGNPRTLAGASSALAADYFDPADWNAEDPPWAKVRFRVLWICDNVDPGVGAITLGLAPVTGFGGTNVDPTITSVGANVISASFTPTAAGQWGTALSGTIGGQGPAGLTAGVYCFPYSWASGSTAASSNVRFGINLQVQPNQAY